MGDKTQPGALATVQLHFHLVFSGTGKKTGQRKPRGSSTGSCPRVDNTGLLAPQASDFRAIYLSSKYYHKVKEDSSDWLNVKQEKTESHVPKHYPDSKFQHVCLKNRRF